ncbi:nucleotidyltransferase family protein [Desulfohalobium retbaense]|uniref:Nucleotidyltransferase-like domain-containing protein n=1 Tax=Desulfohalobium retbaense (strain ATCC 49708 / DSM 5692 / JCM 16813 / HR100) TaxID=485915 RepID=C8X423_DESRD|nr:GSU2403 family nucleotidyltransferase fold protein [Desulfohalobium retbaense]ACV69170.1 conserved hypothetical protein [Desulfohalobium retbaense DSM 5692]
MNLSIDNILDENIAYYRARKTSLVARVLINGRGSIKRRTLGGHVYVYLRRNFQGTKVETYLGPEGSLPSNRVEKKLHKIKLTIEELKKSRHALRRLGVANMNKENFSQQLKDLFQMMDDEGLWDEGLQLVGSWCFKVYQNFFQVEYFPERTIDVDFAIPIPYKGNATAIGAQLKNMGFEEEFNRKDGTISYISSDLKVEFLKPRHGDGRKESDPYIKELDIAPQALPFLNILLENPRTATIRDLGKITIPSMGAFLIHKLIVADRRRDQGKKSKDYRQAFFVAQAVLRDSSELENVGTVFQKLHKKRQRLMLKSSKHADMYVTGATEVFQEIWDALQLDV